MLILKIDQLFPKDTEDSGLRKSQGCGGIIIKRKSKLEASLKIDVNMFYCILYSLLRVLSIT